MAKAQRVVSFGLAFFLLVSTVGAVWLVIAQSSEQDELNQQLTEQQTTSEDESSVSQEGTLEGNPLANYTPTAERITALRVEDIVVGTGAEVTATSTITAHYTGAFASTGIVFQSSKDSGQPFTSSLSGLIVGWQQGLPGAKVGGTRRLFIPASLAYGAAGQGNIPPDSDLIFDIEIIEVQ